MKGTTEFRKGMAELASGIYERGERPEIDYALFDEELARIHLDQGEEIMLGGDLELEYEPSPVEAY